MRDADALLVVLSELEGYVLSGDAPDNVTGPLGEQWADGKVITDASSAGRRLDRAGGQVVG